MSTPKSFCQLTLRHTNSAASDAPHCPFDAVIPGLLTEYDLNANS